MNSPYFRKIYVFCLIYVSFLPPYFDHDTLMQHALHVLADPGCDDNNHDGNADNDDAVDVTAVDDDNDNEFGGDMIFVLVLPPVRDLVQKYHNS